ncbi:hypothetical protein ACP70R_028762 [Stipagrostis hirtigluma subsp. patula]
MAAAAGVGGGDHDLPIEEVGALLASFSGDPAASFPPMPEAEAGTTSREPVGGGECPVEGLGEIEKFLMEGEGEAALEAGVDGFLDGILVGEGDGSPTPMGGRSMDGVSAGEREEVMGVDGNDDGPDIKKKRRQMRNRDSAMKSRGRKKLYVKDLEMKSKYLEAECCRLSYALQCCAAENMALRQCLLKDRPLGAPTVMQESAVLTANPAAGFPALASERHVPIPDARSAQRNPSGSKQQRKRSSKDGQSGIKQRKDDRNGNKW